jgi:methylmalonyl-CoA mutase cobalamin-binding domain/chain
MDRISRILDTQRESLAEAILNNLYQRLPEHRSGTAETRAKSLRDIRYHLEYLSQAIDTSSPALFIDYVSWAKVLFTGLDFSPAILPQTLTSTRDVLRARLSEPMVAVAEEYLTAALEELATSPETAPSFVTEEDPLAGLTQQYLDMVLEGKRHLASQLILNAVESGVSVKRVYLDVLQRAQREIGRLWQTNHISVAQEHYCTAVTQLIISQLYPNIFATERKGHRLVATCVAGELHELGMRMVADFFEMEGWDTFYLGANTPTSSVVQSVVEHNADVLGVSATIPFHVRDVEDLIAAVRTHEGSRDVKILVGGYPFNVAPDLWKRVGADVYAQDAEQAIAAANQLIDG